MFLMISVLFLFVSAVLANVIYHEDFNNGLPSSIQYNDYGAGSSHAITTSSLCPGNDSTPCLLLDNQPDSYSYIQYDFSGIGAYTSVEWRLDIRYTNGIQLCYEYNGASFIHTCSAGVGSGFSQISMSLDNPKDTSSTSGYFTIGIAVDWGNSIYVDNIWLIATTEAPTPAPTAIPTSHPTAVTQIPTHSPTPSPTFVEQECNDMYVNELTNVANFNSSDVIFKMGDLIGINDHLYWDYDNATYRIYYDQQWKIKMQSIEYVYTKDENASSTVSEEAGYPPLDVMTTWYDNATMNSIQLYLSCTQAFEIANDAEDDNTFSLMTFIGVGALLLMGILIDIVGFLFHRKKPGSDTPGYISVIKFFVEIIDVYTDVSFVYSVYLSGNAMIWYLVPSAIIGVAYFLSIITALFKVNMYKRSKETVISNYMKNFDKLWLTLTLIVGFHATFSLLSSHIFHLEVTSFQATPREKNKVKTLRMLNFVIIENLGMLIVQTFYLSNSAYFDGVYGGDIPDDVRVTLLSMAFGIVVTMSGLLTVISRCIACCCTSKSQRNMKYGYLDITSKHINKNHIHSHFLLSLAISKALGMDRSSIEILSIVQKTTGIHCKIGINATTDYDLEICESLFSTSFFKKSDTKKALKKEIKEMLKIPDIKDISVVDAMKQKTTTNMETQLEMEQSQINAEKRKESVKKEGKTASGKGKKNGSEKKNKGKKSGIQKKTKGKKSDIAKKKNNVKSEKSKKSKKKNHK